MTVAIFVSVAWLFFAAPFGLQQVLTVSPGIQEFVKAITKKHLQR